MKFTLSTLILGLSFLLKFSLTANASSNFKMESCQMEKGEKIVVGCTTDCGRFNVWGLVKAARKMGYRIKLQNLYSENQTPDYSQVDAILIPGGIDIDPKYYIDKITPELQAETKRLDYLVNYTEEGKVRHPFEYNLLKSYFNATDAASLHTPVLGICRGMQMLTVSQGIPLYVDIKEELGIKNRRYTLDRIRITKDDSLIKSLQRRTMFRGVELHHQGLRLDYYNERKDQWPQLEVTAISNGNTIAEVIEFSNRPVLGVQFHPEYTFGRTRRSTFSWLLNRACIKRKMMKTVSKEL